MFDFEEEEGQESQPKNVKIKVPRITNIRDLLLFEDDDYLVFNKPPGISTLDERAEGFGQGLLKTVRSTWADAQAAHRLDKETSGVIAFAKNPAAYRHLAMQFEHRDVSKIYHAVSQGVHRVEGVSVYLPILQMRSGYVVIDRNLGKEAETLFRTLEIFNGYTLMECHPITGRMHQIRIHLSCMQASIVSDSRYGGKPIFLSDIKRRKFKLKKGTKEQPLISRVALHARELEFSLISGDRVKVEAPYTKDMEALLDQLRKHAQA